MTGLRAKLKALYRDGSVQLSANGDELPGIDENTFKAAIRRIFRNQGFTADELSHPKVRQLVDAYTKAYEGAISPSLASGVIPEVMAKKLKEDVFIFSGFKTYQELKEVARLLRDDDGTVKPFHRFYNDITAIKEDYNKNYLKAEYIFAQASSEMAAKWKDFEADGDRYNLQYRTANAGKVRPEHAALHNVTLPADDPFWNEFFPPNGWRCRCTVVQVRKGKYPESDSATAIQQGREATYQAGKNGVNRAAIFRFNPGKQQVIFPPHHPYYQVSQLEQKKVCEALTKEQVKVIVQEIPGNLSNKEINAIADNNSQLEKIFGVGKGEPMVYEDANKGKENPKFSESISYQINCQTCVPTHLLRRRGFNIEAAPNINNSAYSLMEKQNVVWHKNLFTNIDGTDSEFVWARNWAAKNGVNRFSEKEIKRFFADNMKDDGLYEIYCAWKRRGAHVFCAEVKEGVIRLFDPQPGKDNVVNYIANMKGSSVGVLRIDNKLVNPKVAGLFIKVQ